MGDELLQHEMKKTVFQKLQSSIGEAEFGDGGEFDFLYHPSVL